MVALGIVPNTLKKNLIDFWLCCLFVALCGLSLVGVSGDSSSLWYPLVDITSPLWSPLHCGVLLGYHRSIVESSSLQVSHCGGFCFGAQALGG